MVIRVMAILLALMFVLGLSSQIILYAGAEELGTSGELRAQHEELSRQRESAQQKLEALSDQEHSAAERYELLTGLDELVSAQIEVDEKLEARCQSECDYLHKALSELLTAAKDPEVVLECGQDKLERRTADTRDQLSRKEEQLEVYSSRLEEERAALTSLEEALASVTAELSGDQSYQQEVQELSACDASMEEDILSEETEEAVKRSSVRADDHESARSESQAAASASNGNATGRDVASFAVQFVGRPYKWGGESLTEGCDCSGFIKSVYVAFDIELPHFSGSLQHSGTGVEYEDAQLGDLICYDGHVGIYLGNDKMVNAFDSKHGIIICSVNVGRLVTVRRIL